MRNFEIELNCSAIEMQSIDKLLDNFTNTGLCFDYIIYKDIRCFGSYNDGIVNLTICIWDLSKCISRFDLYHYLKSDNCYIVLKENGKEIYNSFDKYGKEE